MRVSVHFMNFEQWLGRIMDNQHFTWQCEHERCEDKVDTHKIWNSQQLSNCLFHYIILSMEKSLQKCGITGVGDGIVELPPLQIKIHLTRLWQKIFTDEVMCWVFVCSLPYSLPDSTSQVTNLKAWLPWMNCLSVWILLEMFGVMEGHKSTKYTHWPAGWKWKSSFNEVKSKSVKNKMAGGKSWQQMVRQRKIQKSYKNLRTSQKTTGKSGTQGQRIDEREHRNTGGEPEH